MGFLPVVGREVLVLFVFRLQVFQVLLGLVCKFLLYLDLDEVLALKTDSFRLKVAELWDWHVIIAAILAEASTAVAAVEYLREHP